jgi:hypothetical protein
MFCGLDLRERVMTAVSHGTWAKRMAEVHATLRRGPCRRWERERIALTERRERLDAGEPVRVGNRRRSGRAGAAAGAAEFDPRATTKAAINPVRYVNKLARLALGHC